MPVSPPELIDAWVEYLVIDKGRSHLTASKYASYVRRLHAWFCVPPEAAHMAPLRGHTLLTANIEDLRRFAGLWAHHKGLSAAARLPLVSAIRNFYTWAVDVAGALASNPAQKLEPPRAGKRLPRAATIDWATKLISAPDITEFRGLRDALIMTLLAGCGMRVSGLCSLNEGSLVWTLDEHDQEQLSIRIIEKGKKERLVPAPEEVAMLLRAYLAHDELKAADRALPNGDAVLIINTMPGAIPLDQWHGEGRRLQRRKVLDIIQRHAKRAGIDTELAHPHALRHLYGTELAESDVDVIQRAALMGHSDPRTTEVYTHLAQRKLRQTVTKANPLAKVRAPLLDSLRALAKASKRSPSRPITAQNA